MSLLRSSELLLEELLWFWCSDQVLLRRVASKPETNNWKDVSVQDECKYTNVGTFDPVSPVRKEHRIYTSCRLLSSSSSTGDASKHGHKKLLCNVKGFTFTPSDSQNMIVVKDLYKSKTFVVSKKILSALLLLFIRNCIFPNVSLSNCIPKLNRLSSSQQSDYSQNSRLSPTFL